MYSFVKRLVTGKVPSEQAIPTATQTEDATLPENCVVVMDTVDSEFTEISVRRKTYAEACSGLENGRSLFVERPEYVFDPPLAQQWTSLRPTNVVRRNPAIESEELYGDMVDSIPSKRSRRHRKMKHTKHLM